MNRFFYEKSSSYQGYLIIPFLLAKLSGEFIYSYSLLSSQGYDDEFHKAKNPAGICSTTLTGMIEIAQEHLNQYSVNLKEDDYFEQRYTYQGTLIIIHRQGKRCSYEHYPSHELRNIAAPTLFLNPDSCIDWIKKRLARRQVQF
ncbi:MULTISPECIES: hypothetical protein [Crocosphaera]|uniref:Uncharacterized protein n=5 Tax=Crocosphaera watsonii TaxID=263511 RepID=T2JXL6_CROWT|nr:MULTISPECIES: hypothetical protein [Crocosphaera]EHJ11196.1 hypothetical protein CWATWH0003_4062 [Crocosphaera watsonii WH 0003]MCH2245058.1 hypothetical protein [Crocosphaera sp.]NQZ62362.1 hypothetical protein [Crocosphaera sp.]CCQ51318.1 FIG00568753: hypothetical protein [Crocosphaera watsonii WH 8502]CCQ58376.1 hypothetical protein CWATWH0005_523 [Crocosphaera watsonii WH 0005]